MATPQRLQKALASIGLGSRRKIEEWIKEGLLTINGKVAQLGDKVDPGRDAVKLNGKLVLFRSPGNVYLLFYKPRAVLSTLSDPENRPNLSDYLQGIKQRVFPVGRLDFTSEGLILLTNDGEIADQLQKYPRLLKTYRIKLTTQPNESELQKLQKGKVLFARTAQSLAQKTWIEMGIVGSSAFDLKNFLETRGYQIERMVRIGLGHLTTRDLAPGALRRLTPTQVKALLEQPELGLRQFQKKQPEATAPTGKVKPRVVIRNSSTRRDPTWQRKNSSPTRGSFGSKTKSARSSKSFRSGSSRSSRG